MNVSLPVHHDMMIIIECAETFETRAATVLRFAENDRFGKSEG